MPRKLTAQDVREVSGYSREEFRALRSVVGFHGVQPVQARVAEEFTRQDLLVVAVIRELEVSYGMSRSAVAQIYELLRAALKGPKPVDRDARLLITIKPPLVEYLDKRTEIAEGLVIPLQEVFDRVDGHLGAHLESRPAQRDLKLSSSVAKQRKTSRLG